MLQNVLQPQMRKGLIQFVIQTRFAHIRPSMVMVAAPMGITSVMFLLTTQSTLEMPQTQLAPPLFILGEILSTSQESQFCYDVLCQQVDVS